MCVAFTYTINKCSLVAVAKKTPQGFTLLTHSSEAEAAPGRRGCLWNQSQLASAVWFSWSAPTGRAKGSPFQRAQADWQALRHLHEGLVLSQREGGRGWLLSVPFRRKRTFHLSEIKKCRTVPAVVDITWSWRWSGFQVHNLYVEPLACCAWKQLLFLIWQFLLDWHLINLP